MCQSRSRQFGCVRWAGGREVRAVSEVSLTQAQRVHMVGIGGAGIRGAGALLLQMGKQISGSELSPSPTVESLRAAGATIFGEHAADHLGEPQYVIRSS